MSSRAGNAARTGGQKDLQWVVPRPLTPTITAKGATRTMRSMTTEMMTTLPRAVIVVRVPITQAGVGGNRCQRSREQHFVFSPALAGDRSCILIRLERSPLWNTWQTSECPQELCDAGVLIRGPEAEPRGMLACVAERRGVGIITDELDARTV